MTNTNSLKNNSLFVVQTSNSQTTSSVDDNNSSILIIDDSHKPTLLSFNDQITIAETVMFSDLFPDSKIAQQFSMQSKTNFLRYVTCNLIAMNQSMEGRPPYPPFTNESAIEKVRAAEDAWNSRDPHRVSLAYSENSRWRNRSEFVNGREAIVGFLQRKWTKELDYRLIKELWSYDENRISVRFAYEWHDDSGNWFRSYGNENWEFNGQGLMTRRYASINDLPIKEEERKFRWILGRRPDEHVGLTELDL
ncbi:unnamed protein product [Rotaria magnacalcarata]|uniref:DUF1348 domain-containing protein n=2 Tax=Rotaria magnacalcarata TaxID=392030 RepID=A0A819USY0_9BILA|nr:unnamed protein product [Rotaria magnacalcarata]CAF4097564.1 unnamed protein product [Rotaria magnacalcarata]